MCKQLVPALHIALVFQKQAVNCGTFDRMFCKNISCYSSFLKYDLLDQIYMWYKSDYPMSLGLPNED